MTTAIPFPTPEKPSGGARSQWLRFALPLIVISLLIGAIGVVGYRYLSDEIRRETHRTLAVIAEQKRQQIEAWLGEARVDADLAFYGHSQLELLFSEWSKGERKDPGGGGSGGRRRSCPGRRSRGRDPRRTVGIFGLYADNRYWRICG